MPTPDSGGEWGVLGGSFDPVHYGHLNLAKSISENKHFNGVIFVPSFHHPLEEKCGAASFDNRVAMLELALADETEFLVSQIEKIDNLAGYTIDTLRALKKRYPDSNFYFIIGADLIEQLPQWHRADELINETKFVAGGRPGVDENELSASLIQSVELIKIKELDVSASNIREKIKGGTSKEEIKSLVPDKVADYIFEKNLYR